MRNFRIVKTKIKGKYTYSVCEVYYNEDDDNKPHLRGDFIDGQFSSEKELLAHFKTIVEDIELCIQHKATIIDYDADPKRKVRSNKALVDDERELSDLVI